ncbi:MAG: DNA mismatch repair protein MutS [Planctomycetes bacterium]|nr:DNA mismatch repair protein MutS [Planctomycetota bacterium]
MRQYLEQKAKVGDAILLFRMGDFYETFYDDAKTIARVLGLTLTARDKNSESPVPLAGVPYHSVDRYVARLVRAGYKVAISEQVEDPKTAKGVVRREVVRIITPGTLTDETLLEEREGNYLAALCPQGKTLSGGRVGLACVELSSGRFFAEMLEAEQVPDELARWQPAELLIPEATIDAADPLVERIRESLGVAVSPRAAHVFDVHLAKSRLCEHFNVSGLAGFGFDAFDASLCAAAAVLEYLQETQKAALTHILKIEPRDTSTCVMIDQVTLRSLEVERTIRDGSRIGSLLDAVDLTVNPMGSRRLRDWLCFPLREVAAIRRRQQAVTDLRNQPDRLNALRELIKDIGDLERILARVGVGRVSPRDMAGLGRALLVCDDIRGVIGAGLAGGDTSTAANDLLSTCGLAISGLNELGGYLSTALKDDAPPVAREGGFIADGFNAELDRLRTMGRDGAAWLAEYQVRESQRTGIPTLKVAYNSVFGYYIEITHQHRDKVPPEYVRKQTVRNAERYITDELKKYENEALGAADRAIQLELELFEQIRGNVVAELARLQGAADALANLDVLAGLAELSRRRDYCRPEFANGDRGTGGSGDQRASLLNIIDGRHPVLDLVLAERFVPNDCALSSDGDQLVIITGPNMAGKSTYIRQVALLTLLAHTGSFVPAKSMRLSPVDRIFARVGASDELARGHSTFMVEMVETARILNNATADSLVILDEIGRGTSTYDGLAIAWAITEHLAQKIGCRTLFATHYHELTELADQLRGVANYNVAVREQLRPAGAGRDVVFLHKIVPGPTDRSYGVHVAGMAGLPRSVVRRSESVLTKLESRFSERSAKGLREGPAADPDQLTLFSAGADLPPWWKELVDSLDSTDIERTTPIDALAILERLKAIARDRT